MRYIYLAIFFILLFSGCMVQGGFNNDINYPQPMPVYYSGVAYTYPYYYYGQFVFVQPHYGMKIKKWK